MSVGQHGVPYTPTIKGYSALREVFRHLKISKTKNRLSKGMSLKKYLRIPYSFGTVKFFEFPEFLYKLEMCFNI